MTLSSPSVKTTWLPGWWWFDKDDEMMLLLMISQVPHWLPPHINPIHIPIPRLVVVVVVVVVVSNRNRIVNRRQLHFWMALKSDSAVMSNHVKLSVLFVSTWSSPSESSGLDVLAMCQVNSFKLPMVGAATCGGATLLVLLVVSVGIISSDDMVVVV